jgi:hypothetical protein
MCLNTEIAEKVKDGQQAHQVYDAAHGKYKAQPPQVKGGAVVVKGNPQPFKGTAGGK